MTPAEAEKKPLLNRKGDRIPLWDDPRLSPEDRHNEWVRAHVRAPREKIKGRGRGALLIRTAK